MFHQFAATIEQSGDIYAAYVCAYRYKEVWQRAKVQATFAGVPYSGSVVNMGVKDSDGNICYIIGITKAIRQKIGKTFGDSVKVAITPR